MTTTNARVPAGVRAGGQFAATARSESQVSLAGWTPPPAPVPGAAPAPRPGVVTLDASRLTPSFAARLRQESEDRATGRLGPLIRR
ncbi:hypothetical protein [Cellulosimicrobium sp. Marseille-Q4280]|uniref:hypothetical protein n=1 Tax=Cellulosimicrobium sp. Marseille-Q4280 TaxID=2937992 RepID=UPI00203D2469|nr:hypothetical protein [Cellulosimicrobium sp. Marseille-Q4280]